MIVMMMTMMEGIKKWNNVSK